MNIEDKQLQAFLEFLSQRNSQFFQDYKFFLN